MSLKHFMPLAVLLTIAACQGPPTQLRCVWTDVEQDERECFADEPIDAVLP